MPTTVELVCFAGPMDGKHVRVTTKKISDGCGGNYKRISFRCGGQPKEVMVHESIEISRLNADIVCNAIKAIE